jgi:hypothetical protein
MSFGVSVNFLAFEGTRFRFACSFHGRGSAITLFPDGSIVGVGDWESF